MDVKEAIRILSNKTSEEAVNELKYYSGFNRDAVIQKIQEAMDMGAEALERMTPTPPNWIYEDEPLCPHCGEVMDYGESPCEYCNQMIDWSE